MALEFFNGFEATASTASNGINGALMQQGLANVTDTTAGALSATARSGNRSYLFSSTGSFFGRFGLTNDTTWAFGAGIRVSTLPSTNRPFMSFGDGTPTADATTQVGIGIKTDGAIEVRRGNAAGNAAAGTVLGTSAVVISAATFYYIELVVTCHPSAGTIDVYVNGTNVLSLTGQNTRNTANTQINSWLIAGISGGTLLADDMVIIRSGGAAPNARLGPVKVAPLVVGTDAAVGAGDLTASTPLSGTDRGAMVDDSVTSDDNTSYNALAAVNDADSYKKAAIGVTGTVVGMRVIAPMNKDSTGLAKGRVGVRIAGTNYMATEKTLSTSYKHVQGEFLTNPATGLAWTMSEIDSAQLVAQRTA